MSLRLVVFVLTALAAVVVVSTRVRLRRDGARAGRSEIARGPVLAHTVLGTLAILFWLVFLIGDGHLEKTLVSLVGLAALVCWWLLALVGLLVLSRWLPNRGRHAAAGGEEAWTRGPGLALLGHVGMLLEALVFTYAYVAL